MLWLKVIIIYNRMNGDEVNKGEEETVSPARFPVAPSSPHPSSNSITCISFILLNTTTAN